MLNTSRTEIVEFIAHYVGNKNNQQSLIMSDRPYQFKDDFTRDKIFEYMTSPFKDDIFYKFRQKTDDVFAYDVKNLIDKAFKSRTNFFEITKRLSTHLYDQTIHPKLKGGEVYFVYFKDIIIGGELCDAIGIFKSEKKETFITVDYNEADINDINIDTNFGLNIKKLDKGVLIFNIEADKGYKCMLVDNSHKVKEAQLYWSGDFLNMVMKETPYMFTSNKINQIVSFCGEVLNEENNVSNKDKMMILNNSINHIKVSETFNQKAFEEEVLNDDNFIELFREHQKKFEETYGTPNLDNFEVSQTAVKENIKFSKSRIKLDSNFEVNIDGGHQMIENGYDEEKKMKFYKLYYVNEG